MYTGTGKRGYRPGDEPVPQYHLTKFLGKGQFGEVWQAKGPGGMQVALKIIDLAEREGLKEFAGLQKVKDIRHANLVEFVACWVKTDDGRVLDEVPPDPVAALSPRDSSVEIGGTMLYDPAASSPTKPVELIVAMSLGSKTLFRRLQEINHRKEQKDWTGIPDDELLKYMEEAAKGIDFLNRQGIIHGDIKPQNLLLVGDSVKVCDFGLAQAVDSLRKTQSGMGTVAYAAPELFEGKPHLQSDQYCLAISYVELRTGFLPFDEPNPYKVIELHRNGKLDLQKLSSSERKVIKRATEIKAERRWPSCVEMVSKLRESRQQERSAKGGGWLSILGGRSQPTERLPRDEEPLPDEPVEPGPVRESPVKKGSGGAAPSKKDSAKKKSGPQSPAAARAVQTQRRRGDDTDAIAATVAREDVQEPAADDVQPPRGPSVVRRLMKIAAALCVIGGLAFVGYKITTSETVGQWIAKLIGGGTTVSKKVLFAHAAQGDFDKAVAVDIKASSSYSKTDYDDKWVPDIRRDWSDPATNPVLLAHDDPREAARLLEAAETSEPFRKLVNGVPESLWQPIRRKWLSPIEERLGSGNLDLAVLDRTIEELKGASPELLPTADRKRVLTRIHELGSKRILDLVDSGKIDQAIKELANASAEFFPTAEKEQLGAQIGKRCIKHIGELVDQGKLEDAVEMWKTAPLPSADREALRTRIQKVWEEKRFDNLIAENKFLDAVTELEGSLAKAIFDPTDLAKKPTLVSLAWKRWFQDLLASAKPDGPVESLEQALKRAIEELKKARTYLIIPQDDCPQLLTQVGDTWCKAVDHLAASQWSEAKKLLDTAPEDVVPKAKHDKKVDDIQKAWDKVFDALVKKDVAVLKKDDLDAAERMVTVVGPPVDLFKQEEIAQRLEAVREKRRLMWLAEFDAAVANSDWKAAEKMAAGAPDYIPPEELQKKRALLVAYRREKWDAGFNALIEKQDWAEAKKTLDGAPEELLAREEREKRLAALQTAWDNAFQALAAKPDLDAADQLVATAVSIDLYPGVDVDKKWGEAVREKRRQKWIADFDAAVKAENWTVAVQMAAKVPKDIPRDAIAKNLAIVGGYHRQEWDAGFNALVEKKDWTAAKKALDSAPEELLPGQERAQRLARIQTAWDKAFQPLLDKGELESADKMVASLPEGLFPQPETEKRLALILERRRGTWVAEFDAQVAKPDWTAATKMLDDPPAGYFTAAEIQKKRSQIQASWDVAFKPLPAKGDWEAAKKMLVDAPSHLFRQAELDERLTQIQKPWNNEFETLLAKNDVESAEKMLDKARGIELFLKPVIEEKQAAIKDVGYRKWLEGFDKLLTGLIGASKFQEAKQKLDEPDTVARLRPDGIQTRKTNLRKEWIKWIYGNWDNSGQTAKLRVEVDEFLKASPEPSDANDARLLRARALVHLGTQGSAPRELKEAEVDLRALQDVDLPAERAYVRDVLLAIATKTPRVLKVPANLPDPWGLEPWEKEQPAGMTPEKEEPSGASIATIKKALESLSGAQAKPVAAQQLLDALEKLYPPASPGKWKVDDVPLLTERVPLGLRKLAADVADGSRARYTDQFNDLGRAKRWLQAATAKYPFPEIDAAIYAVATGRLALRVWETAKPGQADLEEVQEWWEKLRKGQAGAGEAGGEDLMAKAWCAECMVALGQSLMLARTIVTSDHDLLLAKQPAYARYLWCRTLKAAGSRWDGIVAKLIELAPAMEGPEPILKAQDRAGAMAELIVEAAGEQRKQFRPWKLDKVTVNPFGDQAEQYAKLLKAARGLAGAGKNPDLEVGLALASFHKAKPEIDMVWPLAQGVLRSPDADKQADLLPLLFVGVSSFWQQPQATKLPANDPQFEAAVRATTRLLQKLSEDDAGKITKKEDAATLYDAMLKPLLEDAEFRKKIEAQEQAGNELLADLCGSVAKLFENQPDAPWPLPKSMPSVYHAIESQATSAINLARDTPNHDKLADYYTMRANAGAYKPDFNAGKALSDVDIALKHKPNLHGALGARQYAYYMRAGQQPKRDQILEELNGAIKAGQEAVAVCPEKNAARPSYLLNLGQAHLVLGNYEPDAKKKKQHLDAARDLASRAAPLVSEYNHSARLLLGNIYEDLASQVREDPKQNYLKAMDRFREVQEKNSLSAQARTSRARCVLKALVTSGLNAQDIGLAGDRDAALKKCIDDLEEAVRYAVQDADRTEAHSQLGQVYEVYDQQGHWAKADENHGKAAELAKQSGASTRAAYVSLWAMLPLNHATRLRPGDSEISKLLDDAERRAKELQGMPPGAYVVPAKQAAIILGSVWQMRGNYEKAVTAYSEGLPPDLAQADSLDVRLLLARAPCNLARPEVKAGKGTAFLQAVLQDASRAAALAPDRADSHYCAAIAYDWLWDADKAAIQQLAQAQPPRDEELKRAQEAAIQHRDEAFNSVHKAVELVPKGDNYVIYRSYGATLIVRVVGPAVAQIPRKDAIAHFEEAERWLQEAIDASQDPEQKKDLSTRIEQVRKPLAQLRGAPPPVPAPNPAN